MTSVQNLALLKDSHGSWVIIVGHARVLQLTQFQQTLTLHPQVCFNSFVDSEIIQGPVSEHPVVELPRVSAPKVAWGPQSLGQKTNVLRDSLCFMVCEKTHFYSTFFLFGTSCPISGPSQTWSLRPPSAPSVPVPTPAEKMAMQAICGSGWNTARAKAIMIESRHSSIKDFKHQKVKMVKPCWFDFGTGTAFCHPAEGDLEFLRPCFQRLSCSSSFDSLSWKLQVWRFEDIAQATAVATLALTSEETPTRFGWGRCLDWFSKENTLSESNRMAPYTRFGEWWCPKAKAATHRICWTVSDERLLSWRFSCFRKKRMRLALVVSPLFQLRPGRRILLATLCEEARPWRSVWKSTTKSQTKNLKYFVQDFSNAEAPFELKILLQADGLVKFRGLSQRKAEPSFCHQNSSKDQIEKNKQSLSLLFCTFKNIQSK